MKTAAEHTAQTLRQGGVLANVAPGNSLVQGGAGAKRARLQTCAVVPTGAAPIRDCCGLKQTLVQSNRSIGVPNHGQRLKTESVMTAATGRLPLQTGRPSSLLDG